jgi:hypothetical protein
MPKREATLDGSVIRADPDLVSRIENSVYDDVVVTCTGFSQPFVRYHFRGIAPEGSRVKADM